MASFSDLGSRRLLYTEVVVALFNSIVFAGVLYAAARITQARHASAMHARDEAV